MLAEDPVFKRMSLFDRDGNLVSSSHADEPQKLPAGWLSQLREHTGRSAPARRGGFDERGSDILS
ncbi:diguanylate cyclase/phosphodiesterase [Pseudomonas fluorescens]|jgi:hypothetical protein|uniref:Uncharacterized protein n=2 Tax=Pseudomonas fluorescens group TaxID=136843 RepID=V8QYU2_9PSED|nr:hypothetical protein HZ99_21870 [Pseudomonas fluorescens]EPL12947.1 diguanylate cyclase/phosphodiesterase [Pseudomonas sp. CF150]ETF04822.1 hypothetical protein PMO01_28640 [Pseudomonas moraviensis R28-S]ETK15541.1 diguanylate cyclase/phosphodiesterase [Pseudomonas sp. FH1]ETK43431.1 hypothetical protein H098_01880 [Pseudomonas fluorescens FH5]KMM82291.1 hypothetical protein TU74_22230 [Pseudomonas lundensis]KTC28665.1 hypothetical protein AO239_03485 [Pseudomonas sp. ICMP 19500]OEC57391.